MSTSKRGSQVVLGLRSSSGRKRITVGSATTGSKLKEAIVKELGITEDFVVKKDANGRPGEEVRIQRSSTVTSLKLKTGDVLYVTPVQGTRFVAVEEEDAEENGSSASTSSSVAGVQQQHVEEDPVDKVLSKQNGRIERSVTPQCQHRAGGQKCLYCAPLEPYDEQYLKDEGIKHMSFHSYLK